MTKSTNIFHKVFQILPQAEKGSVTGRNPQRTGRFFLLGFLPLLTILVLGAGLSDVVYAQSSGQKGLEQQVQQLQKNQKALEVKIKALQERMDLLLGPEEGDTRHNIPAGDSIIRGAEEASVTLIAFGDFQSDYTTRANHVVKRLLQEYAGKLRFVFKHFPMSAIHPQANDASLAALAAERQGKGWEMFDQLLLNSRRLEPSLYLLLAQQLGLNLTQFDRDRRSLWALERLSEDEKLATKVGVAGVPTFFLNGRKMASWRYDYLKDEITKTLRGK